MSSVTIRSVRRRSVADSWSRKKRIAKEERKKMLT